MIKFLLFSFVIFTFFSKLAFAQESSSNDLVVSDEDQIILFSIAILIVIGIFIFMARNIIRKKRTAYDKGDFSSKKNKDYEKYHSDWSDDYEEFGSKTDDEEFRNAAYDKSLPNYYEVLGIEKNATPSEIKEKFRQLAKELHPDKTKDTESESKMAEINKAYEILSDKEKRERYDKYLDVS